MADTESLVNQLNECAEKLDFEGAFRLVRDNAKALDGKIQPAGIREALKKTTKDRLLLSFLDFAEFGVLPLAEVLVRLERLVSFQLNALVLAKAWGLGKVVRLDYFYRRITVDFKLKKGHQFTYAAAIDTLSVAPDGHILVLRQRDPDAFAKLLGEKPGDFVKAVLRSYGDMPLVRLEDTFVANGFVKQANWKKYWEQARAELRHDKLVVIPARRTDPIQLKAAAEDYGDQWLTAFMHETDPKIILADVRDYVAQGKFKAASDETKAVIEDRLAFAVTAVRKVDDALFARLATLVISLGFARPSAAEMREYLWERRRFVKAAEALPAREVGEMIRFLADTDESRAKLCEAIPDLCFAAVSEIVTQFKDLSVDVPATETEPAKKSYPYRAAIGAFMKAPIAPATLTTLIVGKIEQFGEFKYGTVTIDGKPIKTLKSYALWDELPALITLLTHAIALGEGRRNGETLKMQNIVRRLFGDKAWLEKMFKFLSPGDQALFFERFQASIAWDPSTHHTTVVRMVKLVPALERHLVKVEKKKEYARLTSPRSFGLKKREYLKLINEDMPANVRKIEFAKGFGDLSENAEYQYAKDEQRALMQKQTVMQADLEAVKPSDFSDATTDEVMPGVQVVIQPADASETKTYVVLGEWDSDNERGIISSKTRLAENMLGKKVGDQFELPGAEGEVRFATIREILPLSGEIREWMQLPAGVQI